MFRIKRVAASQPAVIHRLVNARIEPVRAQLVELDHLRLDVQAVPAGNPVNANRRLVLAQALMRVVAFDR